MQWLDQSNRLDGGALDSAGVGSTLGSLVTPSFALQDTTSVHRFRAFPLGTPSEAAPFFLVFVWSAGLFAEPEPADVLFSEASSSGTLRSIRTSSLSSEDRPGATAFFPLAAAPRASGRVRLALTTGRLDAPVATLTAFEVSVHCLQSQEQGCEHRRRHGWPHDSVLGHFKRHAMRS